MSKNQLNTEVTGPLFAKLKDQLNQVKRNEVVAPLQYTLQSIEANEKQMNDHNRNFVDNLEPLLTPKDLTREQRRAMLMSVNENKLVVDPEHLDPVLSAYEKTNLALKEENGSLRRDLTALTDTVNLLLSDNAKLREYLDRKNTDLTNLLDTVSEHEGELVQSLRANLNLLADENRALNLEISMLKDLRAKDKQAQHLFEERSLEDRKIHRKTADDLSDAILRNQSLENQIKLLELKVKNLGVEIEEERKKKDTAEKRLASIKTCPYCLGTGVANSLGESPDASIWHSKLQAIKEQEKLQQEFLYTVNDRDELKAKINKLEDTIKAKDDAIQSEKIKSSDTKSSIQKLENDNKQLFETNEILRKKLAELHQNENFRKFFASGLNGAEFDPMSIVLEDENKGLQRVIYDMQFKHNIAMNQIEKMNQDLIDQIRKENVGLKEEVRNLRAKLKLVLEKRTPVPPVINFSPDTSSDEITGLRRHIEYLQHEIAVLQKRLAEQPVVSDHNHIVGLTDDFPDHVSEPTPRRTSKGCRFRGREPSPIDDMVEKINQKQVSRSNTPETVGRYLMEGDLNIIHAGISRKKQNSMVGQQPTRMTQNNSRLTSTSRLAHSPGSL